MRRRVLEHPAEYGVNYMNHDTTQWAIRSLPTIINVNFKHQRGIYVIACFCLRTLLFHKWVIVIYKWKKKINTWIIRSYRHTKQYEGVDCMFESEIVRRVQSQKTSGSVVRCTQAQTHSPCRLPLLKLVIDLNHIDLTQFTLFLDLTLQTNADILCGLTDKFI